MTTKIIFFLLSSYLFGAIPFGLIFGRLAGKDIRKEGSCNIGATNVNRLLGKKLGILTLLCDVAKGFLPVYAASIFLSSSAGNNWIVPMCGLFAVLGHMFSIYLSFSGGKGVATALGVFLFFSPYTILFTLILFVAVVSISGFVSAGSLAAAAFVPICLLFMSNSSEMVITSTVIAILIWIKHGSNIRRILHGEEKSWKTGKKS